MVGAFVHSGKPAFAHLLFYRHLVEFDSPNLSHTQVWHQHVQPHRGSIWQFRVAYPRTAASRRASKANMCGENSRSRKQ
jgi:hypothetical protein